MKDKRWFWLIFIVLFIVFVVWLVNNVEVPMKAPGHYRIKYGI